MPKTVKSDYLVLLADVASVAQAVLEADWAAGARPIRSGMAIRWVWSKAQGPGSKARYATSRQTLGSGDSAVAEALRSGAVLMANDLQADPHLESAFLLRHGLRSAMYLPLATRMGCGLVLVVGKQKESWAAGRVPVAQVLLAPLARLTRRRRRPGEGRNPSAVPGATAGAGEPASVRKPDYRSSPRQAYPYRQKVAPVFGGVTPSPQRFREVQCHDLSTGDISLYLDYAPTFEELVVSLGIPPNVNHVRARVVHVRPMEVDGQMKYLVGCRFIGRVYL